MVVQVKSVKVMLMGKMLMVVVSVEYLFDVVGREYIIISIMVRKLLFKVIL
jgi:hypothetical protein